MPPPCPVPPLALQQLIDAKGKETTPMKQPSFSQNEVLHYPKATTKTSQPHFDNEFMKRAAIPCFKPEVVPPPSPCESYNDDLVLGCFTKNDLTWAGTQKKGTSPMIEHSLDYLDHIRQACAKNFPLSADVELPQEINDSLDWLMSTDNETIITFWDEQLAKLEYLVQECHQAQEHWFTATPLAIKGAQSRFQAVAFHQLLHHFGLGGKNWIRQFIFGFPTTGFLSQTGIFPASPKAKPPLPTTAIWRSSLKRFRERSRSSGLRNAEALWAEATAQVKEGWLSPPAVFSANGDIEFFPQGATNAAFRFGVSQGSKLRACDDLRHNMTNLCTSILTPITLPTWDHLAQMAKIAHLTNRNWDFLKGDHASAYKQLPLGPKYANLSVVTLRDPKTNKWNGFTPKVLLFGAVSAVLRYNCFSRSLAVLINRMFGIPLVSYFDDFGSFCPAELAPKALSVFQKQQKSLNPT